MKTVRNGMKTIYTASITPAHNHKFGLLMKVPTPIAYTTGDNPRDQHFVYSPASNTAPRVTRRVNKLKEAWGV